MSNLIEILPNIYGVKVPMNSKNHSIHNARIEYFTDGQFECTFFSKNHDDRYRLLGTLTKGEISFDTSDVVERHKNCMRFIDYKNKDIPKKYFDNPEPSFRSALPEKIYFENPLGRYEDTHKRHILTGSWQTAQENITEKLLILQKL